MVTSNQDISSDKKNKTAMEEKKREKEKKLDPVGSTVRYEMMKLCTGSVKDTMRR